MTEMERRQRLLKLVMADAGCEEMIRECGQAQEALEVYTEGLPKDQRELLWRYPGAMYYLYHWTLNVVCSHMRFSDEVGETDCHAT